MIRFRQRGDFSKTTNFLQRNRIDRIRKTLDKYGRIGVEALSKATPVDTGKTAASWEYRVNVTDRVAEVYWTNTNRNKGVPIAVVIQYGHAMPNGGYVQGVDYINPAMKPIFDEIREKVWKEVVDK